MPQKIYPRSRDRETVYLKNVVSNPNIIIGDYTMYNDFAREPKDFEKNNVLYQYPVNQDKLIIGKFCSIACECIPRTPTDGFAKQNGRDAERAD